MAKRAEKPTKPLPEQQYLLALLDYDPATGALTWKARPREMFSSERIFRSWNAKHAGKPAFIMLGANGYYYGSIWGERFLAHRVIFKMMTSRDPVGVDHEDGIGTHNAWLNLREADQGENAKNSAKPCNNTSGVIGVYWFKARAKWMAAIKVGGVSKNLGYFDNLDDAARARKAAEQSLGFHKNHGRHANV